jgi:hypothetical protein
MMKIIQYLMIFTKYLIKDINAIEDQTEGYPILGEFTKDGFKNEVEENVIHKRKQVSYKISTKSATNKLNSSKKDKVVIH